MKKSQTRGLCDCINNQKRKGQKMKFKLAKENFHWDGNNLTIEIPEKIKKDLEIEFPASPLEFEIMKEEKKLEIIITQDNSSIDAALQ